MIIQKCYAMSCIKFCACMEAKCEFQAGSQNGTLQQLRIHNNSNKFKKKTVWKPNTSNINTTLNEVQMKYTHNTIFLQYFSSLRCPLYLKRCHKGHFYKIKTKRKKSGSNYQQYQTVCQKKQRGFHTVLSKSNYCDILNTSVTVIRK